MTQRRNSDVKFGISLNFDESNNLVEVAGIYDKSLAEEKNCAWVKFQGPTATPCNLATSLKPSTRRQKLRRSSESCEQLSAFILKWPGQRIPTPTT